ncbi:MAG: F0F1 ATP synthase subunit epsilon [Dolichospermum sp.]
MKLQCVVVTPEKAVVDQEVDSLVIPLFDGEMGILPRRAPLVSKLGNGSLRLKNGSTEMVYFIEGGTVQLAKNVVTLLTPRATEVTSLDVASAKKVLFRGSIRRLVIPKFPYSLLYRVLEDEQIRILAVAHYKRKPFYWSKRR